MNDWDYICPVDAWQRHDYEKGKEMIKKCTCKHSWQDKKYGKQNRIVNKTEKGHRCTVCSQER